MKRICLPLKEKYKELYEKIIDSKGDSLDLSQNEINNEMMLISEALKTKSSLKKIDLARNNFESAGLQIFAEYLKRNCCLECIDLFQNNIDQVGMQYLSESLKTNSSLKKIDLCNNMNRIRRSKVPFRSIESKFYFRKFENFFQLYRTWNSISFRSFGNKLFVEKY